MKKLLFIVFALTMVVGTSWSQDAKKALKNASKDLAKYYQDPINNMGKLDEALVAMSGAFQDEMVKSDPESWIIRGEIYNSIGNAETNQLILNPAYKVKTPNAGMEAVAAFQKAMELAVKKGQTKDAVKGLEETEGLLSNAGINSFQASDYMTAFTNFNTYLQVSKTIKDNGGKSRLDDPQLKADIQYYNVVSGYYGHADDAVLLPLLMDMYTAGTDKSLVYEAIFNIKSKSDEEGAMKILEEGRQKFPDESGLLFAEINHYLSKGKLDVLVEKLKMAIQKEPENVSVYTTLGNVYDQLVTKEREAGNLPKSQEYFDLAYDYYNQALGKDPKNFDATYSIGALYYNKAAAMTADLNKLSNDFSAAGTKKYNTIKTEMEGIFEQALPFFQKAETLDPNDLNTMIALKEIFARKGQLDKSQEYKAKIEAIQQKGK
ncbi:MAG TPA: hypothetical protein PLQ57_01700 [Saprospiraceae bacterium]|nr:hypothetical protein [Saprospiraceae bacterium]HRG19705.1 hypothetical protein [Saprospiraceae bacterium]HRG64181.1 hypothetical protein [Saprospiraceae bacterium]